MAQQDWPVVPPSPLRLRSEADAGLASALTPEERAADEANDLAPENRATLRRELTRQQNPRARGVLESEYRRLYGEPSGITEETAPEERVALTKTSWPALGDTLAERYGGEPAASAQPAAAKQVEGGFGDFLASRYGAPAEPEKTVEPGRPSLASQAVSSLKRGVQQVRGIGEAAVAAGASALGADEVAKNLADQSQETLKAATEEHKPVVGTYKNIRTDSLGNFFSDVASYATEAVFENLPMMAIPLPGGAIGGVLARQAALRAGEKFVAEQVAKGVTEKAAKEEALKRVNRAIGAGALAGAAPGSVALETGSIFADIYEETKEMRPGAALAFGAVAGALDSIPAARALSVAMRKKATEELAKGVLRRYGEEGIKQFSLEGLTEAAQTVIERAAVKHVDPSKDIFTPEGIDQIIDATLKGGLAGGVMGVGARAVGDLTQPAAAQPQPELQPELQPEPQPGAPATQPGYVPPEPVAPEQLVAETEAVLRDAIARPEIFKTLERAIAEQPETPRAEKVDAVMALRDLQADPKKLFDSVLAQPGILQTISKATQALPAGTIAETAVTTAEAPSAQPEPTTPAPTPETPSKVATIFDTLEAAAEQQRDREIDALAREAANLRGEEQIIRAEAAGSGLQPAHTTTMEAAFAASPTLNDPRKLRTASDGMLELIAVSGSPAAPAAQAERTRRAQERQATAERTPVDERTRWEGEGGRTLYSAADMSAFDRLSRAEGARAARAGETAPKIDLVPVSAAPAPLRRAASYAQAAFGKSFVFVSADPYEFAEGAVLRDAPNTVFINTRAERPWKVLVGHETLHSLKRSNERVYRTLLSAISDSIDLDRAQSVYSRAYEGTDPATQEEEMVADIFGDHHSDAKFWWEVFKRTDKGKVRALVNAVGSALDGLRIKLRLGEKRAGYRTNEIITDVEAVRKAMAQAYADWQSAPAAKGERGEMLRSRAGDRVLYHGTNADFDTFKTGRGGMIFLAEEKRYAKRYGKNVIPARANIQRVADLDKDPEARRIAIENFNESNFRNVEDGYSPTFDPKTDDTWELTESPTFAEAMKKAGYDGAVFDEGRGFGRAVAVFDPKQIERADAPLRSRAGKRDFSTLLKQLPRTEEGGFAGAPQYETRDVWNLVQRMERLAREGRPHKNWYVDSGREVLKAFKGDKRAAEIFTQMLAITSANREVKANFTFAEKALVQYANGEPINVGSAAINDKLNDLLYFGIPWNGRKTNTFYLNLSEAISGERTKETTQDMHMGLIAFGKKQLNDAEYTFLDRVTRFVAARQGLKGPEGQAAVWVAQKARHLLRRYHEKGFHRGMSEAAKRRLAVQEAGVNYGALARQRWSMIGPEVGGFPKPREIRAQGRQVTAEVKPSTKLPIGQAVANLSMAKLQKYQDDAFAAVFKGKGPEALAEALGLDRTQYRIVDGAGGYDAMMAPNAIVTLNVDAATAERFAKAWMYIFKQDAVPFFRADDKLRTDPNAAQAVKLRFSDELTNPMLRQVYDALRAQVHPGIGLTKLGPHTIALINFRGEDGKPFLMEDEEFLDKLLKVARSKSLPARIDGYGRFGAETHYPFHDWSEEASGAGLLSAAAGGRPDLQRRLHRWADLFGRFAERRAREEGKRQPPAPAAGEVSGGPEVLASRSFERRLANTSARYNTAQSNGLKSIIAREFLPITDNLGELAKVTDRGRPVFTSPFVVGTYSTVWLKSQDADPRSDHKGVKVPAAIVNDLDNLLQKPIAVYRASERNMDKGSYVAILAPFGDGYYAAAALKPDGEAMKERVTFVASVHPRKASALQTWDAENLRVWGKTPSAGAATIAEGRGVKAAAAGPAALPVEGATPGGSVAPAAKDVDGRAHEAATSPHNELPEPTDAQKEAGVYRKGHVRVAGLAISIENPAGSRRRPEWPTLTAHYGYIRGTKDRTGEQIDVFVKSGTDGDWKGPVFVADTNQPKVNRFDEYKAMIGWEAMQEAKTDLLRNYTKGWDGLRAMTRFATPEEFKTWLEEGDTTKPVIDQTLRSRAGIRADIRPEIDWLSRPRDGEWVSATGDGRYTIVPGSKEEGGFWAKVEGSAIAWAKTRRELMPRLREQYEEDIAYGEVQDPGHWMALVREVTPDEAGRVVAGWQQLAKAPNLFKLLASKATKIADVLREVDTDKVVRDVQVANADETGTTYAIIFQNGMFAELTHEPLSNSAYLNAEQLKRGSGYGSFLYPAVLTWAKNNQVTLIPDPAGLSPINKFRRNEQMFSAALKLGTTRYMSPHEEQRLFGWVDEAKTPEDEKRNLATLAIRNTKDVQEVVPEAKALRYDFDKKRLVDPNGDTVTWDRLFGMTNKAGPRARGVGPTTLARAIFTQSLIDDPEGAQALVEGKVEPASFILRERHHDTEKQSLALYSVAHRPDWVPAGNAAAEEAAKKVGAWRPEKTWKERLDALTARMKRELTQGLFDQFRPILDLSYRGYMEARMSQATDGAVEAMFLYGRPYLKDGALAVRMENGGMQKLLQGLKGEHDRWMSWIAGNRAGELLAQGRENLFTPAEINWMKSLNQGRMPDGRDRAQVYKDTHREFNAYQKAVLDIAEAQGLIDGASRQVWEREFYVPFYRNMEDGTTGPTIGSGLVNQYAFKKLKGGRGELNDLLHNTLKNWSHLLSAAMKNRAGRTTLEAAVNAGIAVEVPSQHIAKQMQLDKSILKVLDGGVTRYFMVDDPFVLDAIQSLQGVSFGPVMAPFRIARRWLTTGVTVNPAFKLKNLARDSLSAIAQNPLSYNVLSNLKRGWSDTAHASQVRADMLASGGIMHFGTMLESDRADYARKLIEAGIPSSHILNNPKKILAMLKVAFQKYQEFGDRGEQVNRVSLYKQLRAQGMDHMEASFAARDMLDFSLQGKWAAVRFLTQAVPFFNARMQGMYKLGRAAQQDYKRMGYVIGALAFASIALMLAFKDDEEWKKRADWDRDNYWWFKIPGVKHAFRIPKPFEIGAVATFAERVWEYATEDEMTGARFAKVTGDLLLNNLAMNPIPQIVKPMIEVLYNKDTFRNRPIETERMKELPQAERMGRNTSLVAQGLGALGIGSPVQMEHLIRGYMGWVGIASLSTLDFLIRPLLDLPPKPAMKLRDAFLVGNFVEGLPSEQSRYVSQFYEDAKKIEESYEAFRKALAEGRRDKAAEIRLEKRGDMALHGAVRSTRNVLAQLRRQEERVLADERLSSDDKRARIAALEERRHAVAKRFSDSVIRRRKEQQAAVQ